MRSVLDSLYVVTVSNLSLKMDDSVVTDEPPVSTKDHEKPHIRRGRKNLV